MIMIPLLSRGVVPQQAPSPANSVPNRRQTDLQMQESRWEVTIHRS